MKYRNLTAVLLTAAVTPAMATSFEEEIIVVSTRTPVPAVSSGTSFSIIEQQQIQDLGYETLAEHLATQVGVSVSRNGGLGSVTSVRVRGEEGYRTLLFIDDMSISDPTAPQVSPLFDDVLASSIERVEILRGPQGMVYGADAGGVISVTSRDFSEGLAGALFAKVGSDGFRRVGGEIGAGNEQGQLGVFVNTLETDGINASEADLGADDDGYDNTTLHLTGDINLGRGWNVSAVARDQDGEVGYDNCGFLTPEHNCHSESEFQAGLLSLAYQGETTTQKISYGVTDTQRDFYQAGVRSFGFEGDIARGVYLANVALNQSLNVIYGVDYEQQESGNDDRDQLGYHLALAQQWRALNYHVGVRLDDNDAFEDVVSYRASGNLTLLGSTHQLVQLKASYGTGFRVPSLFETEYNQQFAPPGTPELSEEWSEGFDLGVQWLLDSGMQLTATWFTQEIEDQVVFDLATFLYQQGQGTSEASGVELQFDWPLGEQFTVKSNYIYLDTEDENGEVRARRAKHEANIGLLYTPVTALRLNTQARLVKDVSDIDGSKLDDYTLIDVNLRYQLLPMLGLSLNITNLMDEDYQQASGFFTPGRQSFLGVDWSF